MCLFLSALTCLTITLLIQGELAHRLVKRLYGLTNKKDAMAQISKKYTRHQALHSAQGQEKYEAKLKGRLEDHHIISESRNTPVQLFEFVKINPNDLSKKVYLNPFYRLLAFAEIFRTLFLSCRTTFLAVFLGVIPSAMSLAYSQMKIEIQSAYATIQSMNIPQLASTTLRMTCGVTTIQSTRELTLLSWFHRLRRMLAPTLSGMLQS
jgi:hypothetical protein